MAYSERYIYWHVYNEHIIIIKLSDNVTIMSYGTIQCN